MKWFTFSSSHSIELKSQTQFRISVSSRLMWTWKTLFAHCRAMRCVVVVNAIIYFRCAAQLPSSTGLFLLNNLASRNLQLCIIYVLRFWSCWKAKRGSMDAKAPKWIDYKLCDAFNNLCACLLPRRPMPKECSLFVRSHRRSNFDWAKFRASFRLTIRL